MLQPGFEPQEASQASGVAVQSEAMSLPTRSISHSHRVASRGKIEEGFDGLEGDSTDNAELGCKDVDDVDWRMQMCMIGEAACDGTVMQSKRSRMARAARMLSCS